MGFQGQLNSVNLADIFQTLSMNRQTGTLGVSGGGVTRQIWFDQGLITRCTAAPVNGRPAVLHALQHRGLVTPDQIEALLSRFRQGRQPLRDLIQASALVADPDLSEITTACAEEAICPIFELVDGDFTFQDGNPSADVMAPDAIDLSPQGMNTSQMVLEATRRLDEWKRIRDVIPDTKAYYHIDNEGRANLRNIESDPEMLKVLRYLDGRHTIEAISHAVGVSRFDAFAIVAQLVLANIARPRTPQEAVSDALALRDAGDKEKARELLENTFLQYSVPEVERPLAELSVQLNQVPRAVELYLDLIQRAQDAGDPAMALADLDVILTLSPNDPDLHYDRAQTLADLNRGDEAASAYVQAAQHYLSSRKVERAADACHRAKNLQPRNPEPHRFLAKAYLLEGQTENATVEYKSLWHALLSVERPRKALEQLRKILDSDCKFQQVKDQVLAHAQSSEAVKTGNAVRMLVYAAALLLICAGGFIGWRVFEKEVIKSGGLGDLTEIRARMQADMAAGLHEQIEGQLTAIARQYSNHSDIRNEVDNSIAEVRADAEKRATSEIESTRAMAGAGRLDDALRTIQGVLAHFPNAKAAIEAEKLRQEVLTSLEEQRWKNQIEAVDQLWQSDAWDDALVKAKELAAKDGMPPSVRQAIAERVTKWTTSLGSAQDLFRRAERLETQGRKFDAHTGYRRALLGDGESYRARAKDRLVQLERGFCAELGGRMDEAFQRGDDQAAFAALDELRRLGQSAATDEVPAYLRNLQLPFVIGVDSRFAFLVVRTKGQAEPLIVRAPDGTGGAWTYVVRYRHDQQIQVELRRSGFAIETVAVAADNRRSRAAVHLKRGPLWQSDLGGIATTRPVACGKFLLIGTNRSTLEVVDPGLGGTRPVVFTDSVSEVTSVPFVHRNFAYLVIDDRVVCVDIDTRTVQWSWPGIGSSIQPQLLPQTLWVQEHELIQGRLQIFVGSVSGRLICLGAEGSNIQIYPPVVLESAMSGSPAVVHSGRTSTLFVPAGQQVTTFDATSPSESTEARKLYTLPTRGDVIGRPLPINVAGHASVLVTDSSGVVVALDANPNSPRRTVGSWSLEGSPIHGVVPHPQLTLGYVAVSEGRLLLLDLAQPGRVLKRFPPQGTLGTLPGPPSVGRNGVYLADSNGILYCVHPETGLELWRADLGSQVTTGILAMDGRIFVPTAGGGLMCFEEGDLD